MAHTGLYRQLFKSFIPKCSDLYGGTAHQPVLRFSPEVLYCSRDITKIITPPYIIFQKVA